MTATSPKSREGRPQAGYLQTNQDRSPQRQQIRAAVAGRQPVAIALELGRGTEDQWRWRDKVEALAAWAAGPYRQAFGADTLTIAVVTPSQARREALRSWTAQELTPTSRQQLAEIFLFTCVDPVTIEPSQLFFDPCWYEPTTAEPVSLLLPQWC